MEFQKLLLFWVCCQSLVLAEELNEGTEDPSTNYVFNLPDIVANYKTLGEEVQLEAFGASGVNISVKTFFTNPVIAIIVLVILLSAQNVKLSIP